GYDEHSTIPAYAEPLLVFSAPFQAGATAYRLSWGDGTAATDAGPSDTAADTTNAVSDRLAVEFAWSQPKFSNDVTTCVVTDDLLFGFDLRDPQSKAHRPSRGEFRCLDMQTGEILWSEPDFGQSSMIASGNRLLLFSDAGTVRRIEVSRDGAKEQAVAEVFPDHVCWTRPTFADGLLYLRGGEQFVCLDLSITTESGAQQSDAAPTLHLSDLPRHDIRSPFWLLNGEREHPFMPPEADELLRWYLTGLACVLLPGLLIPVVDRGWKSQSPDRQLTLLCGGVVPLALIATPLLNRWGTSMPGIHGAFVFTWPAGLFALLQVAVLASQRVTRHPGHRHHYWAARLWGGLFIAASLGYYLCLKHNGLPLEWVFLVGYVSALPVALWTARVALGT
ncbi:MAG: hypothetical protein KDA58_17025, partial [Planctomycetaceae bacterium]|nr:hypothetical protein [Planctomycetaceae bacterium]